MRQHLQNLFAFLVLTTLATSSRVVWAVGQPTLPAKKADVDLLVQTAQSKNPSDRQFALERLSEPNPAAKAVLETTYIQLLDSNDPDVRSSAARACGKLKTMQAVPKLRGILKSIPKHKFATEEAVTAEGIAEYTQALPVAQALSDLGDINSVSEILNRDALSASWELLLPPFGNKALPMMVERARISRVNSPGIQTGAMRAISAIRDGAAVPNLKTLLSDRDSNVRKAAARALEGIGTADATAAVEGAYSKLDDWGKIDFLRANIKQRNVSKTLQYTKDFLNTSHDGAKKAEFINTLAMTGNPAVVPYLKELLKNSDEAVRPAAACQLAHLTGKIYPYHETNWTRLMESHCKFIQDIKNKK